MEKFTLKAEARTALGKKNEALRGEGLVPAVVYGHGSENQNISVDAGVFRKLLVKAGESSLIDLSIGEAEPIIVLVHEVQYQPVTGDILHVDFHQVRMDEKLKTHVPIVFVGEAPAVKEQGGMLVKAHDTVEVECLPKDLVHELSVDLDSLKTFSDAIRVKDVVVPEGVVITGDPEAVIVSAQEPRKIEEEAPAASEEEAVAGVEVEEKGKKEEGEDGDKKENKKE